MHSRKNGSRKKAGDLQAHWERLFALNHVYMEDGGLAFLIGFNVGYS